MKIGEIDPKDKRFWPDKPDEGFNPERNKSIVDRTIAKYEATRALKRKQFNDQLNERTNAIASYLAGMEGAQKGRSLERYFGRRYLAKLRGEEIVDVIRNRVAFGSSNDINKILIKKDMVIKSVSKKKANKV